MLQTKFRPIESWPGKLTRNRKRSRFGSNWDQTTYLLERELAHLNARNVVFQIACDESDIRLDGSAPRSNARPDHPGVIISCESKYGSLSYPCDTFDNWKDNVRAIALALEALRKVDRYGVTKTGQQYTGWRRLGSGQPAAGGSQPVDTMSVEAAAEYLLKMSTPVFRESYKAAELIFSDDVFQTIYKRCAHQHHPDMGGDAAISARINRAGDILKRHHIREKEVSR